MEAILPGTCFQDYRRQVRGTLIAPWPNILRVPAQGTYALSCTKSFRRQASRMQLAVLCSLQGHHCGGGEAIMQKLHVARMMDGQWAVLVGSLAPRRPFSPFTKVPKGSAFILRPSGQVSREATLCAHGPGEGFGSCPPAARAGVGGGGGGEPGGLSG